jgi:hypothetical protein
LALAELRFKFFSIQTMRLTRLDERLQSVRVPKEFAIIFYGLAVGFGFGWLMGFAIGYPNLFVPVIPFALAVFCLWVGLKLER